LTISNQTKEPKKKPGIVLTLKVGQLPVEGYKLLVKPNGIQIAGGSEAGVFYGIQTLLQLLPAEAFGLEPAKTNVQWVVPCIEIKDQPRYSYRGMHLDVSRHFFRRNLLKDTWT